MKRPLLVPIAAGMLVLAIAAATWWVTSPQGVRRAGVAIALLAGMAGGLGHIRRLPASSPTVLYITALGGAVVLVRPAGSVFPIALWIAVALAWMWFAERRLIRSGERP